MTDSTPPDDPEKVGYGRPPKASQFKKGQSGHPGGRTKRAKNFVTQRDQMLDSTLPMTDKDGRARDVTTLEATFLKLRERALKDNDLRAQTKILDYGADRHEEEMAKAALAERRALEEHEMALLLDALPRLQAKLASQGAPS